MNSLSIYMYSFLDNQYSKIKNGFSVPLRVVGLVASILFMLSLFDGILSFIVPDIILSAGRTETQMGLIIASSSLFGLFFDFALTKMLRVTHYWTLFLYTIVLTIVMPTLFFAPSVLALTIVAMAVWALYYNLWSFAVSDFTARGSKMAFHSASAGILYTFGDLGSVIGTLVVEPLQAALNYNGMLYLLIGLASVSLIILFFIKNKKTRKLHFEEEGLERVKLLKVVKRLWPMLLLYFALYLLNAIKWTVTPVISHISESLDGYGGLILALSAIPAFAGYALVHPLAKKIGKKRLAIYAFIAMSILTILEGFSDVPIIYMSLITLSGFVSGIIYAAFGGIYADYLKESKSYDPEILVTQDMATNLSYIVGPILGGILMQAIGSIHLYIYIGIALLILSIFVLFVTPRRIDFHDKSLV